MPLRTQYCAIVVCFLHRVAIFEFAGSDNQRWEGIEGVSRMLADSLPPCQCVEQALPCAHITFYEIET